MRHIHLFRFIAIALLGLLISFLLKLYWPSAAFGQASLQTTLSEAEKSYVCFSASREYSISELQGLSQKAFQTEIVEKLAKQLSGCVSSKQNRLSLVDLSKLAGVTYTTKFLNNGASAVVVAGVGKRNVNDIDLTSGLEDYSVGMADFLVKNANQQEFSVELNDTEAIPVDKRTFRESLLSWKAVRSRVGRLILTGSGNLAFPTKLSLSGNKALVEADLAVQHEIPDVQAMPPHFKIYFKGEASDQDLLSNRSRKLGKADLTFEGLLLKGVPQYIENKASKKKLEENGIAFEIDPKKNDSWAKFSKTLEVPKAAALDATLTEYRKIEKSLSKNQADALKLRQTIFNLKSQQEKATEAGRKKLEAPLQKAESDLQAVQASIQKNITAKYERLNNLSLTSSIVCAPEFMREFKFPIFERKVSANGQGGSASAGIGVTGDVVIDIAQPTCNITFSPPFKVNSSIYSDISISSNGYFGGRADALGEKDFGTAFSSSKGYGNYSFSSMALSEQEKEAIAQLVLKSVDNAMEDEKLLNDLAIQLEDEFVSPMLDSIENALIGTDAVPIGAKQLCSLFEKAGARIPGSEEDLVCWALSASEPLKPIKPTLPRLTLPPEPPLPPRPSGACRLASSLPCKYTPAATITVFPPYPCPTKKNWFRTCNTREVPEIEIPPGCRIAKNANDTICKRIKDWEDKVADIRRGWETAKTKAKNEYEMTTRKIEEPFNREFEKWQKDFDRWTRYGNPTVVRGIAKNFVRDSILLSSDVVDVKAIARKLLDVAWKLEESGSKANELIDLAENYLQKLTPVPKNLSISVKASGRVGFVSQVRLLETSPQFTNNSELEFKDGKPSMKVKFSAYKNRPEAQEGYVNGLAPIGVIFNAQQVACIGGTVEQDLSCSAGAYKIDIPWGKNDPLLTPAVGSKKIARNETVVFDEPVSLQIKS